jgi:hypothetical protein
MIMAYVLVDELAKSGKFPWSTSLVSVGLLGAAVVSAIMSGRWNAMWGSPRHQKDLRNCDIKDFK